MGEMVRLSSIRNDAKPGDGDGEIVIMKSVTTRKLMRNEEDRMTTNLLYLLARLKFENPNKYAVLVSMQVSC